MAMLSPWAQKVECCIEYCVYKSTKRPSVGYFPALISNPREEEKEAASREFDDLRLQMHQSHCARCVCWCPLEGLFQWCSSRSSQKNYCAVYSAAAASANLLASIRGSLPAAAFPLKVFPRTRPGNRQCSEMRTGPLFPFPNTQNQRCPAWNFWRNLDAILLSYYILCCWVRNKFFQIVYFEMIIRHIFSKFQVAFYLIWQLLKTIKFTANSWFKRQITRNAILFFTLKRCIDYIRFTFLYFVHTVPLCFYIFSNKTSKRILT